MSTIRIPGALQPLAGGADEVFVLAATVADALAALVTLHPRLRRHLFDERGALRGYVNVYLNEEDVRFLDAQTTRLQDHDVITIVPSVAGGSTGQPTLTGLIDYEEFCGVKPMQTATGTLPELTPADLKQQIDAGTRLTLIDVREPFEWEIANLARQGARLIPLGSFAEESSTLDPAELIVVYCRSGARSASAVKFLLEAGFTSVWNLRGGIRAWSQEIEPSLPIY